MEYRIGGWSSMQNNKLYRCNDTIIRILDWQQERVFLIDCKKCTMPKWISAQSISDYKDCTEEELLQETEMKIQDLEELSPESRCFVQNHFSLISCILPFVMDDVKRSAAISRMAEQRKVSKQTIRKYLCLYLAYQDISVFAPVEKKKEKELTKEQKNFRWALNKFFYTKDKNSLRTAYTMMLKEKYCNSVGELITPYPTFCQFRYFYRQNKNIQNYYISRNGIRSYQRDNRPLLGDGIQEFASNVGVGMLDATICDIYLVNEMGNLIGRPILTACIDAYSGLCCGYSLSWEGGVYSLRNLMVNIITDKVYWCKKFGISIYSEEWNCNQLPGVLVTDMGSEYKSETFEQISELGVTVVNLPPYRPELKGAVEKFFDLIQESYKKHLKGKGVIEPDYQERGAHDYRKDACLTMADFERVILHCIIYYNSKRVVENFPYTEKMLVDKVQPFANKIFAWGMEQIGANLISVEYKRLVFILLPRTQGKFTRFGLRVNKLRYKHENYVEKCLAGGCVTVAYNPEDVSNVWVIEKGNFVQFNLIEERYEGMSIEKVNTLQKQQKEIVKTAAESNLQAQIDLANHLQTIADSIIKQNDVDLKAIRKTRKREQENTHMDHMKEGVLHG